MPCSIEELTFGCQHPEQLKQLDLSATSKEKVHHISHLEPFINLRILILSNHMIHEISNVFHLRSLKILNLEFNQIKTISGISSLKNLQELFLSYNEIQDLGNGLAENRQLRVLHLAYNDLKSLENISALYQVSDQQENGTRTFLLPNLSVLTLFGNPVISTINYLSFLKMLIPSLKYLDDRDVNNDLMTNSVCPQEQVVILREAINNLLDQRNAAVEQLESFASIEQSELKPKREVKFHIKKDLDEWKALLLTAQQKYAGRLQQQKSQINSLSEHYTRNIKNNRMSKSQQKYQHKVSFNLNQDEYVSYDQQNSEPRSGELKQFSNNKEILEELKQLEKQSKANQSKIKNISRIIAVIQQKLSMGRESDIEKIVLEMIVFGIQETELKNRKQVYYKLCKKFLIEGEHKEEDGMLRQIDLLKMIIFGNSRSGKTSVYHPNTYALYEKIKDKNLLEIIAELKNLHLKEEKKMSKFEKERQEFIQKFEEETKQLGRSWDELNKERELFRKNASLQLKGVSQRLEQKQSEMQNKLRIVEEEEKVKIVELKKEREKLEQEINVLENTLSSTEQKIERKFLELEEFQNHFNQFIEEKEKIQCLQNELINISTMVENQRANFEQVDSRLRELELKEGILQNKIENLQHLIANKSVESKELIRECEQKQKQLHSSKQQIQKATFKMKELSIDIASKIEQIKGIEKMSERIKKNYSQAEEKLRNIEQIETNKRMNLKDIQSDIRCLKDERNLLSEEISTLQKTIQVKREELVRCQLKIQQSKMTMETLSDLNKSVNDMLIRQSELKRSIIELEIENKNLSEMKNNMLEDMRLKTYI